MSVIAYILLAIYSIALLYITVYCLLQFHLLIFYKKHHWSTPKNELTKADINDQLPFVTVQLPIFNERYVVERLIDNITSFNYPKNRFEIQVLDDSTDDTIAISRQKVAEYKAKGFNIKLFHRTDRSGYKAGALKEAMPHAQGEFIAIFDADFLPNPDFLLTTIPKFDQPEVGIVQTRWEHINQNYSVLTRLQAMQLNVHFTVEQQGRRAGNCLLQFNGTAGVWRRSCIEDAGGWEADTLTEDLDLSYRAQLKGWKIVYLEEFGSPAELPAEMNALKSQQFRWMKGGAENARKLLPAIWQSDDLTFHQKIHASSHLLASGVFIFIFISGVFSVPLVFLLNELSVDQNAYMVFALGLLSISSVFYVANVQAELNKESYPKMLFKFLFLFPIFLALSMGLSLHNSIAVLQGYAGKKSPFVRTPKFNIQNLADSFKQRNYLTGKISWTTIMEGLLSVYFLLGAIAGIQLDNTIFLAFHILLSLGFGTIFYYTVRHLNLK
jgi:cellulose synthase/poly-beta-1,6-N-acetylglucosamine synthase-like glycosyltransferase